MLNALKKIPSLNLGGMFMLPQKHKSGTRVKYNSGFFITTNIYPDFGSDLDNQAIARRLEVFNTKSLKKDLDKSVMGKIF